jgi:hypothetical protein
VKLQEAGESGCIHRARVATFTVPGHGLASGAGSDGRVKGATLAWCRKLFRAKPPSIAERELMSISGRCCCSALCNSGAF